MKISILTLFPEMFKGIFDESIIKRAQDKNLVTIEYVNIRDFGIGKHKVVDDTPYGGGVGMIIRVDVLEKALRFASCKHTKKDKKCKEKVILTDARGETFTQKKARDLLIVEHLIVICGHYEAIDERIEELIDERVSIGDYILTGGEIPAMAITDAVVRLVPGVLSKKEATLYESFSTKSYLEHPQYTKPQVWHKHSVPEVLLSGNHEKIRQWREKESKRKPNSSMS